jgi:hypothetical protein
MCRQIVVASWFSTSGCPGVHLIECVSAPDCQKFVVRPSGANREDQRIAVTVEGDQLAALGVFFYLDLDRTGRYLKTVRSDFILHSTLDRMPLLRLEYRADMRFAPVAHQQFHAERGAFSHLLARAHALRPAEVKSPHKLVVGQFEAM